jgi:hypothetical protein
MSSARNSVNGCHAAQLSTLSRVRIRARLIPPQAATAAAP